MIRSQPAIPAFCACVLDEDAELAAVVAAPRLEEARRASVTNVLTAAAGTWAQPRPRAQGATGYGVLVLDGLLARRAGRHGRYGAELLAAGDLLRPWDSDDTASTD